MLDEHKDIKILNNLIETTLDSADGYSEAAKDSENNRYASLFNERANERRNIASTLQREVVSLGGTAEDEGTVLAAAHRMFTNLRNSIAGGDVAIVDEVERGEDHIKAKYEKALRDTDLSPTTRTLIEQAYASVKAGHDQMRDLKRSLHAS